MAKKNSSLVQGNNPYPLRPRWSLLLVAIACSLGLLGLDQIQTPMAQWGWPIPLFPHPIQQLAGILRYLLPALFMLLAAVRMFKGRQASGIPPAWLSVPLALGFYMVLEAIASASGQIRLPETLVTLCSSGLAKELWGIGQYALPAAIGIWALLPVQTSHSAYSALFDSITDPNSSKTLESITWREFEQLVTETFRRKGFKVEETQVGADGGVDLIARHQGKTYLVQCKQWKAFKVGVNVVRELYGVMAAEGAFGGYVVTSGQFTDQARAFAVGLELHLIDGAALEAWIGVPPKTKRKSTAPKCPLCQGPMQQRTAHKGPKAGTTFWGCKKYPACKGTRSA